MTLLLLVSLFCLFCGKIIVYAQTLEKDLTAARITIISPGDANYASARQAFNQRFSYYPSVIAYPSTTEEVSTIVKIGASHKLRVVARSGGHSYIANGLGGANEALVVDLSRLTRITVQASNDTAIIEPGNRLGEVALTLNRTGRAIPHGTCPYVGIGGHSGFGGFGFTSRMWGLTLDVVVSATVVLSNGTIARASNTINPELFWAIRGSSASFGIVTSIEVTTFAVPRSAVWFSYRWNMSASQASKALAGFQAFVQTDIPPELGGIMYFARGSVAGSVTCIFTGVLYGSSSSLDRIIHPLLAKLPKPMTTHVRSGSYIQSIEFYAQGGNLNTSSLPEVKDTFYAKSLMVPEASPMSDRALDSFTSYMANEGFTSETDWFCEVELYGGKNSKINSVPLNATAFAHRSSMFTLQMYASSSNNAPYPSAGFSFLDGMMNSIVSKSPYDWDYGAYINYIDDRLADWKTRYYGPHYARLVVLKRMLDPHDVFVFPTAIGER